MSVYSKKGKGWRYDFTLNGQRHTQAWFKTKTKAKQAEADRRKEVLEPKMETQAPTDMEFSELVNRRLDHVKVYHSERYYSDYCYLAKRWVQCWGQLQCSEITSEIIEQFVLKRAKQVSAHTANVEIRCLRATFNFGKKKKWIPNNPTDGIESLPVNKKVKYVPAPSDVERVIAVANPKEQDYLITIRETMARVGEINKLTWVDVDLAQRSVTLYTRKKKGSDLTPRTVYMTERLFEVLTRRHSQRDLSKPWVFWHTYWNRKSCQWVDGPYKDRKQLMTKLCKKAGVKYFRYHALRHSGASIMESNNVPIRSIQSILGHENRKTTEIYLHSTSQADREAMSVFEKACRNSHTIHTQEDQPKWIN